MVNPWVTMHLASRRLSLRLIAALVAMAAAVAGATPAAARPAGTHPGGAWTSVRSDGVRGIALVEWDDESRGAARLSLHLAGLEAGDRLRVVLSSASCDRAATGARRLWSHRFEIGSKGRVWQARTVLTLDRGSLADVRSVRLMEEEGIFYLCRAPTVWDDTDIVHVRTGAVAVMDGDRREGIVVVGPATATGSLVTWSLTLGSAPDLRLVATTSGCSTAFDADATVLSLLVQARPDGTAFHRGRTETVDKDETITIHALRLKAVGGEVIACRRPAIIAIRPS